MESKDIAAFNLALQYLMRIDRVFTNNYVAFKEGNTRAFLINCRQLYRELYPFLTIDTKKGIDETAPIKKLFRELSVIPQTNKDKIWEKMEDIEDLLRHHFKTLGMLMPKVSDPRFLFGNKQK